MILLFYSNECKFCIKLLEYLKKNNLEKQFKMLNIDIETNIPDNITIVPTIIDEIIEAPLEGKKAFEYVINQKYFNHPTNNINLWINKTIPKPVIEEDSKAFDGDVKLTEKTNTSFVAIDNIIVKEEPETKKINSVIKNKINLSLLKLKR
jgi:thiol-disulfide isomerase/thioredoxin